MPPPTSYSCNQSIIDWLIDSHHWLILITDSAPHHWHLFHCYVCVKFGTSAPAECLFLLYIIAKSCDNVNILVIYCINYIRYLVVLTKEQHFKLNYSYIILKIMIFVPCGTPWNCKEINSLKQIGLMLCFQ